MKILQAAIAVLALTVAGTAWAAPIPEGQESAVGIRTFDLPSEQTGSFELSFDATPLADKIDVFTGLSAATPGSAAEVSVIVRFNDSGSIDARNAGSFKADQPLAYSANKVYRVRMVVDVANKTYSVFVTPAGQPEVALAKNYAFRTQRVAVQSLGKIVLAGFNSNGFFTGAHRITAVSFRQM